MGDFSEDGHQDLAYIAGEPAYIELVEGQDGTVIASRSLSDIGSVGENPRLQTVPVAEGDRDDLMLVGDSGAFLLDAEDLATLGVIDLGPQSNKLVVADVGFELGFEIFDNSGGAERSLIVPSTNEVMWTVSNGDDDSHSYFGVPPNYPAVVDVDGDDQKDIVIGGRFGDLTAHRGNTGRVLWRVCLARGGVTSINPDVPPTRDLCDGDALSDVTSGLLNGDGDDAGNQLMVGSADGWVYAVHAQTGEPFWTIPFYAPVGEVMAANTDNDTNGELLINLANGSSLGFRDALPPTVVRDVEVVDDQPVNPDTDIDVSENRTALSFNWDLDEAVEYYEVAVVGDDGTLRSLGSVGFSPSVTFRDWDLKPGATYWGLVRGVSEARGLGHIAFSDGVTIADDSPPEITDAAATPEAFSPALGGSTEVSVSAIDAEGLRAISISAALDGEDPVWTASVAGRRASELSASLEWSGTVDDVPLADGDYSILVTASDFGGNEVSTTLSVRLDSTPPPAPSLTAPEEGQVLFETVVSVVGSAQDDAATVEVYLDGELLCTAEPDGSGVFACDTAELGDGEYSATARAADALGNWSEHSAPTTFRVNTTPPVTPVITNPVNGMTIEDITPSFDGTAEPGATVVVSLANDSEVCTSVADDEGGFSCVRSEGFAPGEYTVYAVATAEEGGLSPRSDDVTFTVAKPPTNNGANNGANNGNNGNNGGNNGANNGVDPGGDATAPSGDGCGCQTPASQSPNLFSWLLRR
jgi:hypothetical protein